MNLEKKIYKLLDSGFSKEFVISLNESNIDVLYERLKRKEQKEAVTTNVKKTVYSAAEAKGKSFPGVTTVNPDGSVTVTNEGEMVEKFESKAQQGLFWARCNKCKTDDCKWCKMAKEFSKSTSKKQYENMPEKKHPEKTVNYKKKKTNEDVTFGDAYSKMIGSAYSNEMMGKLLNSVNEEKLNRIIEKNIQPTMKKKDLLNLIENQIRSKKKINEDFYFDDKVETIESSVYDPVKKYSTNVEPEKKKEKSKVAKVEDCENSGNFFYINPKKNTSNGDVYMITNGGSNYCVQVVKMVNEEPEDYKIIESYDECNDCIIDLKLSEKSKEKETSKPSFGLSTDRSEKSGEGFKEVTPQKKSVFGKKLDPETKTKIQAKGEEDILDIKENFFKEFNKINEIINRKNNNI